MKFALLMFAGTCFTRILHHWRNGTKSIDIKDEVFDFMVTYVIYTICYLLISSFLYYCKY